VEPELVFILDKNYSHTIGEDPLKKMEYLAIFTNGMNNYYARTNETIGIRCEVVGVMEIDVKSAVAPLKSEATERYGTVYDMYPSDKFMMALGRWAHANMKKIGPHDLAPLLTSTFLLPQGIMGVSPIAGVCQFDHYFPNPPSAEFEKPMSMSSPMARDPGACYSGVHTLAHEIGHR
jgi:hypothetical protein